MRIESPPTRYAESVGIIDRPQKLRYSRDVKRAIMLPIGLDCPGDGTDTSPGRFSKCDSNASLLTDRRSMGFDNCDVTSFMIPVNAPVVGPVVPYTCKIAYVCALTTAMIASAKWVFTDGTLVKAMTFDVLYEVRPENYFCWFQAIGVAGGFCNAKLFCLT